MVLILSFCFMFPIFLGQNLSVIDFEKVEKDLV